jgi:hypothetical protein
VQFTVSGKRPNQTPCYQLARPGYSPAISSPLWKHNKRDHCVRNAGAAWISGSKGARNQKEERTHGRNPYREFYAIQGVQDAHVPVIPWKKSHQVRAQQDFYRTSTIIEHCRPDHQ